MKMPTNLSTRNLFLGGLSLLLLSACRPLAFMPAQTPLLTVATVAPSDHATVTATGADVVVAISSATGIGTIDLSWSPTAPPASVTLHLALQGLEEIRMNSAAASVTANVLSHLPYTVIESAALAGQPETPITPESPYWATITVEPANGAPATITPTSGNPSILIAGDYFAVQIPSQLLSDAQGQLAVRWIDFYR